MPKRGLGTIQEPECSSTGCRHKEDRALANERALCSLGVEMSFRVLDLPVTTRLAFAVPPTAFLPLFNNNDLAPGVFPDNLSRTRGYDSDGNHLS